ncbi:MAG: hypothetical protein ABW208_29420 [Pyrinomonadaceae bacterium]
MHPIDDLLPTPWGVLTTLLTALCVAAVFGLAACGSKELNRSGAADVLEASDAFKNPASTTLHPQYRQSLALGGAGSQTTPKEEFALKRFFESHPDLAVLDHLGLAEFKVANIQYPNSAASPVTVTATLTDQGKSTSDDWQQSGDAWTIPVARRELVEVTGLTGGEGESKTARVEYTWRWKPLGLGTNFDMTSPDYQRLPESVRRSPGGASFADALRGVGQVTFFEGGKLQKGSAVLQKYDNGWRVAGDAKAK